MPYRTRAADMPMSVTLGILALVAAGAVGWIWNIIKIVGGISEPLSAMFIARCVGIFAPPLGAVLGFL